MGETRFSSAAGCLRIVQTTSISADDDSGMTSSVVSEDIEVVESFRSSLGGRSFTLASSVDFLRGLGGPPSTDSSLSLRFPAFGPDVTWMVQQARYAIELPWVLCGTVYLPQQ
jgi:hypothetical protein